MVNSNKCSVFARVIVTVMVATAAMMVLAITSHTDAVTEGEQSMSEVKEYFVRLLGTRDGWPSDMTAEEQRIMSEHFEYLKELVKQKKVLMAGPCFDPVFGLIILRVNSPEEARAVMDNEPSVKHGVHTYDLNEMNVSLMLGQE